MNKSSYRNKIVFLQLLSLFIVLKFLMLFLRIFLATIFRQKEKIWRFEKSSTGLCSTERFLRKGEWFNITFFFVLSKFRWLEIKRELEIEQGPLISRIKFSNFFHFLPDILHARMGVGINSHSLYYREQ